MFVEGVKRIRIVADSDEFLCALSKHVSISRTGPLAMRFERACCYCLQQARADRNEKLTFSTFSGLV